MTTYVAFLAGINVGGRRVTMDRLRTSFEKLGYDDVSTFIASGNVIFKGSGAARAMEQRIATHMERELGFSVNVFVRSASALAKAVAATPFAWPKSGETVAVGFMATAPSAAAKKATGALSTKQDRFVVIGKELHWHARGGLGQTSVSGNAITKALGQPFTVRNIKSLRKLVATLEGAAAL